MARKVVLRPAANRDLDRLYDYVGEHAGAERAVGYIRRIRAHCDSLAEFPERGARRDDIRAGLRIAGFERRVAIAFTFDAETVTIVRVFYGGRDYEALLCETDRAGPARPER